MARTRWMHEAMRSCHMDERYPVGTVGGAIMDAWLAEQRPSLDPFGDRGEPQAEELLSAAERAGVMDWAVVEGGQPLATPGSG